MDDDTKVFLERWHRVVAARDVAGVAPLLAPQVSLGAPPYWPRFEGHELVHHLLGLILQTIEGFTYHREWGRGRELALEFRGSVDGLELQGIDLITLDERAVVANLDVLMRPMNAIEKLQERIAPQMAEWLAGRAASGGRAS